MSFPDWGDVPTWGLFGGAIVTAVFAILAFREQSKEVSDQAEMLKVQGGELEQMKNISDKQAAQLAEMQKTTEEQLTVLKLQAEELRASLAEREREASGRHRAQAARVFITEHKSPGRAAISDPVLITGGVALPPRVTAVVHNTSEQPVYDVELRWHRGAAGYGDPNPEPVGVIMPGEKTERSRDFEQGTNMAMAGAVARFTDASGVRWLRRPEGELIEQPR